MTHADVVATLEAEGCAHNRGVYGNHGATGALCGVSTAELHELWNAIKIDHEPDLALRKSDNIDAERVTSVWGSTEGVTNPAAQERARDPRGRCAR